MVIQDDKMVFYVQTDDGHAFVIGFEGFKTAIESAIASYIKHIDGNFHAESIFANSDVRMVIFNKPLISSEWPQPVIVGGLSDAYWMDPEGIPRKFRGEAGFLSIGKPSVAFIYGLHSLCPIFKVREMT